MNKTLALAFGALLAASPALAQEEPVLNVYNWSDYIAEDTIATWMVWLHWAAWKNADPAELALPLADFAVWLQTTPELKPFRGFAECPPARWALAHAPGFRAARASADAELRLAQERDEQAFTASAR